MDDVRPFNYRLKFGIAAGASWTPNDWFMFGLNLDVNLNPAQLESELGAPLVWDVSATVSPGGAKYVDALKTFSAAERMRETV